MQTKLASTRLHLHLDEIILKILCYATKHTVMCLAFFIWLALANVRQVEVVQTQCSRVKACETQVRAPLEATRIPQQRQKSCVFHLFNIYPIQSIQFSCACSVQPC